MNKVILSGNLTKDAETRSNTNTTIISFSIGVRRNFKNASGEYDSDFINCKYFRKEDNISKYLLKGTKVLIEGRVQVRNYDDKDGNKKYVTEIVVESAEFVGAKKDNGQAVPSDEIEVPQNYTSNYEATSIVLDSSDLPF